jgi:hypothetical protein
MGADVGLKSVLKAFLGTQREHCRLDCADFTQCRCLKESGGYFRDAYNAWDLLWALGLSWTNDVLPMLVTGDRLLPIAAARFLISTIEERPLSRERVERHYLENVCDGIVRHPVTAALVVAHTGAPGTFSPPDFASYHSDLLQKRERLLALLRKSVELNEPLVCSL